jgi:hypothetical protein
MAFSLPLFFLVFFQHFDQQTCSLRFPLCVRVTELLGLVVSSALDILGCDHFSLVSAPSLLSTAPRLLLFVCELDLCPTHLPCFRNLWAPSSLSRASVGPRCFSPSYLVDRTPVLGHIQIATKAECHILNFSQEIYLSIISTWLFFIALDSLMKVSFLIFCFYFSLPRECRNSD